MEQDGSLHEVLLYCFSQYGLFLKAVGLSLEEAMAFMREEFTKRIDSDKVFLTRHSLISSYEIF